MAKYENYSPVQCPFCRSEETKQIDFDHLTNEEIRKCCSCDKDYVIDWGDDPDLEVIEQVTDRHRNPVVPVQCQ